MKLWLVEIAEDDWDYDNFVSAVVWAETPKEAEEIIRAEWRHAPPDRHAGLWIENPAWKLEVRPAQTVGVPLVHWHAG